MFVESAFLETLVYGAEGIAANTPPLLVVECLLLRFLIAIGLIWEDCRADAIGDCLRANAFQSKLEVIVFL